MKHTLKTVVKIGVVLSIVLLSACSPATPEGTATVDLNAFRTEVAATVLAQVSEDAARTPSATPQPTFTATLAATNTPLVSPTALITAVITTTPGVQASTIVTGTATLKPRDQAQWVSQTIPDGTTFEPAETFTMTWTLKNVGESTWTAGYLLRFYSGNAFGAAQEYPIGQIVPPNQTLTITIPMTAPTTPGEYRTDWVLADESRANFKDPIFLKIAVAAPATLTPTPRPPTPTATP